MAASIFLTKERTYERATSGQLPLNSTTSGDVEPIDLCG